MADETVWTVTIPDDDMASIDMIFMDHLARLINEHEGGELDGEGLVRRTYDGEREALVMAGYGDLPKEVGAWVEAIARDSARAGEMHRQRYPNLYEN